MRNQVVYLILLLYFVIGGVYNLRIRKQCIYPVKLTKPRAILLIIAALIFFSIAYVCGNLWYNYLLAISATIFIVSGVVGEGIHERGIYYRSLGSGAPLIRLAKWEDIMDIKIDTNTSKLESFKLRTTTVFPDQYYNAEDIDEIGKCINVHRLT